MFLARWTKEPITTKTLIEAMAANGDWSSTNVETPTKFRFVKTDKGKFGTKG